MTKRGIVFTCRPCGEALGLDRHEQPTIGCIAGLCEACGAGIGAIADRMRVGLDYFTAYRSTYETARRIAIFGR